jgi:O-antigen ligase
MHHSDRQKFHNIFLYIFVFLLPWQTIWIVREVFYGGDKWQYGTIGVYLSDVFLIAWLCSSLYYHIDIILEWITQHRKMIISLLFLDFWLFASILWADDPTLAFYHALLASCAIDLTILLWIIPFSLQHVTITLILSACMHALIGIYQFFTQNTFANTYLGTQLHDIIWGGTATITSNGERWLRAYGGMPHPNMLGGLLIATLLLVVTLYITTKNKTPLFRILSLFACGTLTLGLLATFSRTAWLTAIISLCMLFIFFFLHTKKRSVLIVPFITISAITAICTIFFGYLFFTRITHDTLLTHNSFNDRGAYITHARTLITEKPLIGAGIGNYTNTAYNTYRASHPIWYFQPVHNAYILACTEIGIVGCIIFVCTLVYCIAMLYHKNFWKSPLRVTYALIFVVLCVTSLFDHWTLSSHFGILFCALCIGIFLKTKNTSRDVP